VLVAGSGVMGRGIAASFAQAGLATAVLSRRPEAVSGLHPEVTVLGALPEAAPELIIESIPEVPELKLALYAEIEARYGGAPVLGSHTSGLSLPTLAAALSFPERFCGIHYLQPADVAPLVEVARIEATAADALASVLRLLRRAGKTPTAIALARIARRQGLKPGVLAPGYGGSEAGPLMVGSEADTASRVGDEPLLLAASAPTAIGRERAAPALRRWALPPRCRRAARPAPASWGP